MKRSPQRNAVRHTLRCLVDMARVRGVDPGRHAAHRAQEMPAPFIVGSPRSGTTLLRMMLDSHPLLAIPPETGFIPALLRTSRGTDERQRQSFIDTVTRYPPDASAWADFGMSTSELSAGINRLGAFRTDDAVRSFYKTYAERFGKIRWGDKTPGYGRHMRLIQQLLPEARFIHIIRDGRDAALSLRHLWFSPGSDMQTLARHWRNNVEAIRREAASGCHYLEVRYEALILDTEMTLRRICGFLDLGYDAAMQGYHCRAPARLAEHRERVTRGGVTLVTQLERLDQQQRVTTAPDASRVHRWRIEMQDRERAEFEAVAGNLLASLNYSVDAQ